MSNTTKFSLILIIVFVARCSSSKKALMQTWKVADVVFTDTVAPEVLNQRKSLVENLKTYFEFTFSPDSAYQVVSRDKVVRGKWWMSSRKTLVTASPQGTFDSQILELNKNRLVFESKGGINKGFRFICIPFPTGKK